MSTAGMTSHVYNEHWRDRDRRVPSLADQMSYEIVVTGTQSLQNGLGPLPYSDNQGNYEVSSSYSLSFSLSLMLLNCALLVESFTRF